MKTFMEIAKEAQELEKELYQLHEEKNELHWRWKDGIDPSDRETLHKVYEKTQARLNEIYEIEPRKELRLRFLKGNAKYVLIQECLPTIIEVLEKYKGKPYGEKTKAKISDEIAEKLNITFYISGGHWNFWHKEYHPHGYDVEISNNDWEKKLLIDNKIQVYPIEELGWYRSKKYTEDIDAAIDNFLKAYSEVYEAQKELKNKIGVLNNLCADGMNSFTENTTYREKFSF